MIRKAENKDVKDVTGLLIQVNNVHAEIRPDLFIADKTKYSEEELIKIFSDPETPVFVYEGESGRVIGYAFCIFRRRNHINNPEMTTLYIDDICVDENERRKGIASALFEYVKTFAKESGCHNITLNVWMGNEGAERFYEKCGMKARSKTMETVLE